MGKVKKYQQGGFAQFLTGIDSDGGGYDEFKNPISSMIPGGGALAGLGQVAGGIADIVGSKKEIERQRRKRQRSSHRASRFIFRPKGSDGGHWRFYSESKSGYPGYTTS